MMVKNEQVHRLRFEARAKMIAMSFEYLEVLYNRKRQHSTLGYKSPIRRWSKKWKLGWIGYP